MVWSRFHFIFFSFLLFLFLIRSRSSFGRMHATTFYSLSTYYCILPETANERKWTQFHSLSHNDKSSRFFWNVFRSLRARQRQRKSDSYERIVLEVSVYSSYFDGELRYVFSCFVWFFYFLPVSLIQNYCNVYIYSHIMIAYEKS